MDIRRQTPFIGIVMLLMTILAMLAPNSAPGASARTLVPLSVHNARQVNSSELRHLVIPLSPTSNCNLDGPNSSGVFPCGVESIVAPGCLIEHSSPFALTTNRTGNCYKAGTILNIVCQTKGGTVNNATNVWDELTTHGFVTDFYMDTSGMNGATSPPIGTCVFPI